MINEQLAEVIASLKGTDVEEFLYEADGRKISFKKTVVVPVKNSNTKEAVVAKVEEKKYSVIKSPMVGTFYQAESRNHPPFVIEGNHIIPGQKVGLIQAMKIYKDVLSDVKGKISKILVKNGEPVEYGQELVVVDPE